MNVLNLFLKVSVLKQIIFGKKVERSGSFFEDRELCLMLISFAVDEFDMAINSHHSPCDFKEKVV